ncbi:hypothetical protein CTAYLR_006502 [Chrysophaeum taylorii]|uniref:Methyltransferase type 11 domain-containing protein n=1 Tax=Chrysophaeum taylorii TaxID=2483200 RepID=A0AAD7ULV8_9STRA|nr:hypothetical protein CTAYLR_006502 [Chrysophaeum taylorii]
MHEEQTDLQPALEEKLGNSSLPLFGNVLSAVEYWAETTTTTLRDVCLNKSFEISLEDLREPWLLEPHGFPLRDSAAVAAVIESRRALEIGGPTPAELGIYDLMASCDNVAQFADPAHQRPGLGHDAVYNPLGRREMGRYIVADAHNLTGIVAPASYELVYASHVLEHMRDPIRALLEWDHVLVPGGTLFLIVPWKQNTFDHFRAPNTLEQLAQKYVRGDDAALGSDFEQTVRSIDMSMDYGFAPGSTFEALRERTLGSAEGREMLHYHVFDFHLLQQVFYCLNYDVVAMDLLYPFHQVIVGTKVGVPAAAEAA